MDYSALVAQWEVAMQETPRNESKIQHLSAAIYAIELSYYSGVNC